MVLHFLQCGTMPPVLPNLQHLYPDTFSARRSVESLELFRELPHPLPAREINMDTVGELLIAFFAYYRNFDFATKAISISRARVFDRFRYFHTFSLGFSEKPFHLVLTYLLNQRKYKTRGNAGADVNSSHGSSLTQLVLQQLF
ncbi:unnamed protein product [Gongylonema pulchrum]|uniref:PAP-associated domain-containing protein n=1 Tax=Gongylonema pulchrum TaxID=637853 RepID=A0A183E185_9BILA|nr:unnamed protein product [Gongylonema pulchrum]